MDVFHIVGLIVCIAAGGLVAAELVARGLRCINDRFLTEKVSRFDYIPQGYHPYLSWLSDWTRPAFNYVPIGLRLFNTDIVLPGNVVTNNSLGFRCDEFAPPEPDTFRIVLLGGSAAWGSGASDNDYTIAGQLERLLNAEPARLGSYKKAKVYNLAQVNGLQTHEIISLLLYGVEMKPDLVISYNGWNEIFSNFGLIEPETMEKFSVFYISEMMKWKPLGVIGEKERQFKQAFSAIVRERSALAALLPKPKSASYARDIERDFPVYRQAASRLYLKNFELLRGIAGGFGFTYVSFLQPHIYKKAHLTHEENRILELYHSILPVAGGRKAASWLAENDLYGLITREGQEAVHDLSNVYAERTDHIYNTLVHTNDQGYALVADRILSAIRPHLPT